MNNCLKCGTEFNYFTDCGGTGYTWSSWCCSNCGQLHAVGRYIPIEVRNDSRYIIGEDDAAKSN